MRVGVVGAGVQATRRLPALRAEDQVVAVSGPAKDAVADLAGRYGAAALRDWHDLVARDDVDAVVVATPPNAHEEISVAALRGGKHVLCEKPLASSSAAAERMARAATDAGRVLHCGFNHRFHPAVARLREVVWSGRFGDPLAATGVYGHGIRDGYRDEWRADPAVVSGGQLMEQGIHLIDLMGWILGPVAEVVAQSQTCFGLPGGLEDDAHVLLRTASGRVAFVRSSLNQWRNRFLLEVTCERATVRVDGIGGSYGDQTLTVDHRGAGPFEQHVEMYRGADRSWAAEWRRFTELAAAVPAAPPDPAGRRALATVEAAYRSVRDRAWVAVPEEGL